MYRKHNEVERLFGRLKGFLRVCSRFDKLDAMFIGFIHFALIVSARRFVCVNRPDFVVSLWWDMRRNPPALQQSSERMFVRK
jgi:hypothetical protein